MNNIKHVPEQKRFSLNVDGQECLLEYRDVGPGIRDYYHTFVPPELRGQQLAEQLTVFALEDARANNLKIIPSCPYIAHFIRKQTQYQDLVK